MRHARKIPEAVIGLAMIDDGDSIADHVCCQGDRVEHSDIDLLRDLDGIIDIDTEISNGALDLRMSKQELDSSKVPGSPADQHGL